MILSPCLKASPKGRTARTARQIREAGSTILRICPIVVEIGIDLREALRMYFLGLRPIINTRTLFWQFAADSGVFGNGIGFDVYRFAYLSRYLGRLIQ